MEGWWKDGRRVCEDRARILKQNSQYQVKLSQLSQFGGSQAKVRWSDLWAVEKVLLYFIFYILYFIFFIFYIFIFWIIEFLRWKPGTNKEDVLLFFFIYIYIYIYTLPHRSRQH